MFIYNGVDPDTGLKTNKEFESEDEAIDFARQSASDFPNYTVKDSEGTILDSNILADEEIDATMKDMFPDEESAEGFDVDDFWGTEND